MIPKLKTTSNTRFKCYENFIFLTILGDDSHSLQILLAYLLGEFVWKIEG